MALQHLRSSTASKRPTPASMSDGQLAMNTNLASPGLFFKDSNGDLVKVGPVHVGATAPNASPASGGQAGNSKGEQWLDTSGANPVLKVWDGTAWQSQSGEFVNASGDVMTGALGVIAGTISAPGLYVSGDTNTGLWSPAADELAVVTGGVESMRVDSGQRVLSGHDASVSAPMSSATLVAAKYQQSGNFNSGSSALFAAYSTTASTAPSLALGKSRGATGAQGLVSSGDSLGRVVFLGSDGQSVGANAGFLRGAVIESLVDGTAGAGSMPTRLSFQTTPAGSATPTERLQLNSSGQVLIGSSGTAALPSFGFTGDPDTGLYSAGADLLGFATGGALAAAVDSSGNLRLYNSAGTFYHNFSGQPTANRTITLPDASVTLVSGTMVPTTGTGATGTWGINVTGNAATVTNGLYTNVADTITSTHVYQTSNSGMASGTSALSRLEVIGTGGASFMSFHRPNAFAGYFGLDSDNQFKVGGWSFGAVAYPILHSNNYNTYAPTKTGGGASGTWGINITGRGFPKRSDGGDLNFFWSGQSGQPSWLWGGSDGANMYVYNPSNFSVNYANSAGTAGSLSAQSFQGVGTYALCRMVANTSISANENVAGSNLRYAGGSSTGNWVAAASSHPGTWRNMGVNNNQNEYCLYTRVA